MNLPAPLAVPVEVRALDTGPDLDRVWRLALAIGEAGLQLERDLPWAPGRPVRVELVLPDDPAPLAATGVVAPRRSDTIAFTQLDPEPRRRLAGYVQERMLLP